MKGMTYTPFAILATSMMFLMFISPLDVYPESVNQDIRPVETSQTLDQSLENSFKEGFGHTVNEHLQEYNENLGTPKSNAKANFSDEYNPDSSTHYSLTHAESDLNNIFQSSDRREINLDTGDSFSFTSSGLTIESTVPLSYSLADENLRINNTLDTTVASQASIDGAKDPLAKFQAGEDVDYSYCGFEKPAYYAGEGDTSSGSVISGEAIYRPKEPGSVSNKGEKILFIESASEFDNSNLDPYAAVIVEDDSYNNGNYVQNFNEERIVNSGENIIVDSAQVYISYFRQIIDEKCFVESDNAPDLFDRMENSNVASDQGIMTFITNKSSYGSPNEDYIHYDSSRNADGSSVNVTGLNSNDNNFDQKPWFNVDSENLQYWDLTGLEE